MPAGRRPRGDATIRGALRRHFEALLAIQERAARLGAPYSTAETRRRIALIDEGAPVIVSQWELEEAFGHLGIQASLADRRYIVSADGDYGPA